MRSCPLEKGRAYPDPSVQPTRSHPGKLGRAPECPVPVELAVRVVAGELERRFSRDLWFVGELLQIKSGVRGHGFGVLRGAGAKIDLFFAPHLMQQGNLPEAGSMVLVCGRLGIWQPGGRFQIWACSPLRSIDSRGERAETRRAAERELRADGILDRPRRDLPRWPSEVAVVTSARGAAIHDIRATLLRRAPWVAIRTYDCAVQGPGAAASIIAALDSADRSVADVVLLARGGGAPDSLDPFDDPHVVRRVAHSRLPIVVAVGHEPDHTLAGLAADLAASTPTAAAELAVPDKEALRREVNVLRRGLYSAARASSSVARTRADHRRDVCRREARAQALIWRERIDRITPGAILVGLHRLLKVERTRLSNALERVQRCAASILRQHRRNSTAICPGVLVTQGEVAVRADRHRVDEVIRAIRALSPQQVLARGYALVIGGNGIAIRSASDLRRGETVWIRLGDGTVAAVVSAQDNQRPDGD